MSRTCPSNLACRGDSSKATVSLVALCFVSVLGLSIAGYIAVCSRAMTLSNRSFQARGSQQLAEMGIDEALRAFNKNNWTDWSNGGLSADWTLSGTTATCNLTFPAGKFGQGVTGSVKIRVDNYNAAQLDSTWASSTNYRINDLVGYNGIWYRCLVAHTSSTSTNRPPNLAYWAEAPIPWTWSSSTTYAPYDVVNYQGTWYRYSNTSSTSGNLPTVATYWTSIPTFSLTWVSGTSYAVGAIVYNGGSWYYCITAHTSSGTLTTANATYWSALPYSTSETINSWNSTTTYYFGDKVLDRGDYFICKVTGPISGSPNRPPNNPAGDSTWGPYTPAAAQTVNLAWNWNSTTAYKFNDVVYYGGVWYRFIYPTPTAGITPGSNASYWETSSSSTWPWAWSSSTAYNLNDTVYHSSSTSWYRCILAHSSSQTPSSSSAYWSQAPRISTNWDSGRYYNANDTARYSGVWYRCLVANNGSNPSTNATNWASAANSSYYWSASTAYTTSSYVSYGGIWYQCATAHTNQSPTNTTYWTALAGQPVVYAEGTIAITGNPSIKTQLRATIAPAALFPNAAAAIETLTISGGGTVDSYDSTLGTYASQTPGYSAVLAATNTTNPAATVTSTTVNGYVAVPSSSTSPYAPLWAYGGSAVLRGTSSGIGIDQTRVSRSPYIPQFASTSVAGTTVLTLTSGTTTTIGTPGAATPVTFSLSSGLDRTNNDSLIINGPVILNITGGITTTTGKILITSAGSAEIHFTGALSIGSGSDGIDNQTADPKKLILIGRATAGSHSYAATTKPFYGVIYMPNNASTSALTINTGVVIYGALSAKNITFSNEATVHYDTSLRYATFGGVDQPYTISEWRELPATEQATMP